MTAEETPYDDWIRLYLRTAGLPDHVQPHIATMAKLHREGRYDRWSDDVEKLTGEPARTIEEYVAMHPDRFGG